MNITPRVAEGADDELVFCEKGEFSLYPNVFFNILPKNLCFEYSLKKGEEKLSDGAEKLFQKFITHAFAKGRTGRGDWR